MIFRATRIVVGCRSYSTARQSTIQLLAELRKATNAPIMKVRQALTENGNNVEAALAWLEKDLANSGAEKASKFKGRTTAEGLISISVLNGGFGTPTASSNGLVKAAMIELNCETDFVARTEQFTRTAAEIAHSVAATAQSKSETVFQPVDVDHLLATSLNSSIRDLIARTGENITLRRATTISCRADDVLRLASYAHNASAQLPSQGRIGALSLLSYRSSRVHDLFEKEKFVLDAEKIERALARQIVGFSPASVNSLYDQQFAMLAGDMAQLPVHQVMSSWKHQWALDVFQVVDFVKWEVGEQIQKSTDI